MKNRRACGAVDRTRRAEPVRESGRSRRLRAGLRPVHGGGRSHPAAAAEVRRRRRRSARSRRQQTDRLPLGQGDGPLHRVRPDPGHPGGDQPRIGQATPLHGSGDASSGQAVSSSTSPPRRRPGTSTSIRDAAGAHRGSIISAPRTAPSWARPTPHCFPSTPDGWCWTVPSRRPWDRSMHRWVRRPDSAVPCRRTYDTAWAPRTVRSARTSVGRTQRSVPCSSGWTSIRSRPVGHVG